MPANETKAEVCLCDGGNRHPAGESLTFKAVLGFRDLATAQRKLIYWRATGVDDPVELATYLSEYYLLHMLEAWGVRDAKGKPVPCEPDAIRERLLSRPAEALEVADFADDLYREAVIDPLVARASRLSAPTPTGEPTLPTPTSGKPPRKPSRPSLTTTTPMAGIGITP